MAIAEPILHHYDTSPFSEKARVMFGRDDLAWASVIQPTIMPKPDLTPLTGGYRRIPVLQIGADLYCDSQIIMATIAALGAGEAASGLDWAVNLWADRLFFQASVGLIFGEIGAAVPRAFIEDREQLMGRSFDVAAMKAAAEPLKAQWRAQASWIDDALGDGGLFLGGERPGVADAAAYMNPWFLSQFTPHLAEELFSGLDRLKAWMERLRGLGHGHRREITPAEALVVAARAEPAAKTTHDQRESFGMTPGQAVCVRADDYGRDPIEGVLVAINRNALTIARRDERLGALHLHFPRAGYIVARI
ncbi:MAG TPA: glutathione S-transferase N-terminal domain-containing protein [Caulobacteraceae bacterium]